MSPAFEFTIVYDADSARAAARVITMRMWGRLLKLAAVLTPLSVAGIVWLARTAGATWFYWLFLPLVVGHAGQGYVVWAQSRRWMKAFTGSARVTLSETDFGIASNNGSHVMPWGLFKESYRDSKNLFLFLSKTAAIVIPKKGVPPAAVEFMVDHVRRGRSGQGPVLAA